MMTFFWCGTRGCRIEPIVKFCSVPLFGNQALGTTPFSIRKVSIFLGAAVAALAVLGRMASRAGSAIATPPAPRRRARRLIGDFIVHLLCCGRGTHRSG